MKKAKLFKNGQSQAVRLPWEFRFEGTEVFAKRAGNGVLLLPVKNSWEPLISSLEMFSTNFMVDRAQPKEQQTREHIF